MRVKERLPMKENCNNMPLTKSLLENSWRRFSRRGSGTGSFSHKRKKHLSMKGGKHKDESRVKQT
jgi:hypothetical protein